MDGITNGITLFESTNLTISGSSLFKSITSDWYTNYFRQFTNLYRNYFSVSVYLPPHECLIHRLSQVEDMITDGKIVFQSKWWQYHSISHRKRQPKFIYVWKQI